MIQEESGFMPAPCPFCGCRLVLNQTGNAFTHPHKGCIISPKQSLGVKYLQTMGWNNRATGELYSFTVGGVPIINEHGIGEPVWPTRN